MHKRAAFNYCYFTQTLYNAQLNIKLVIITTHKAVVVFYLECVRKYTCEQIIVLQIIHKKRV